MRPPNTSSLAFFIYRNNFFIGSLTNFDQDSNCRPRTWTTWATPSATPSSVTSSSTTPPSELSTSWGRRWPSPSRPIFCEISSPEVWSKKAKTSPRKSFTRFSKKLEKSSQVNNYSLFGCGGRAKASKSKSCGFESWHLNVLYLSESNDLVLRQDVSM